MRKSTALSTTTATASPSRSRKPGDVLRAQVALAVARGEDHDRLVGVVAVGPRHAHQGVAVRGEHVGLDHDAMACGRRSIEAAHHQVQVDGEAVHHHGLARTGADQAGGRLPHRLVVGHPGVGRPSRGRRRPGSPRRRARRRAPPARRAAAGRASCRPGRRRRPARRRGGGGSRRRRRPRAGRPASAPAGPRRSAPEIARSVTAPSGPSTARGTGRAAAARAGTGPRRCRRSPSSAR